MIYENNKIASVENEYEELVMEIKKDLPNLVLPSMGMFDEVSVLDINGKDFVISNKEV